MTLLGCKPRHTSGKVKLTYNTFWTGRDAHGTVMDWMYAEFRKRHPEIDFEVTQVAGGAQDNGQKQMAELAAGGGPDILHDSGYDQVVSGYCLDLTDHISPWKDRFYPEALANCTWDGRVYNFPTEYSFAPCIWNLAVLEKVGKKVPSTFDEYMDVGDALKKKGIPLTSISVFGAFPFAAVLCGFPEVAKLIRNQEWESEPFQEAMKVCKQIIKAGFVPTNDMELQFPNAITLFQNDQFGHYANGAWTLINEITAEGVDPTLRDRVAFAPFPSYNGVRPLQAWVATKTALNQRLRHNKAKLEAAIAFMELFTSKESAERFVSMAHSPEGVKVDITEEMAGPLLYKHIRSQDEATFVFVLPNSPPNFEMNGGVAIGNAFAAMLEGASAEKAVKIYAENMRL